MLPLCGSFSSKYNIIKLERIRKLAIKIICATGDLNYEQQLKATDMPSMNDFLTEMCHKQFYRIFRNDKDGEFSQGMPRVYNEAVRTSKCFPQFTRLQSMRLSTRCYITICQGVGGP